MRDEPPSRERTWRLIFDVTGYDGQGSVFDGRRSTASVGDRTEAFDIAGSVQRELQRFGRGAAARHSSAEAIRPAVEAHRPSWCPLRAYHSSRCRLSDGRAAWMTARRRTALAPDPKRSKSLCGMAVRCGWQRTLISSCCHRSSLAWRRHDRAIGKCAGLSGLRGDGLPLSPSMLRFQMRRGVSTEVLGHSSGPATLPY